MERTPTFTPTLLPRRETNGIAALCRHAYALWLHMQPAGLLADPNETTRTLWAALRDAAREAGLECAPPEAAPDLAADLIAAREAIAALTAERDQMRAFVLGLADNIERHNANPMDDAICNQMLAECLSYVVTGDSDEAADTIVDGLRTIAAGVPDALPVEVSSDPHSA